MPCLQAENEKKMPPKEMQDAKDAGMPLSGKDTDISNVSLEDQVMLTLARLMEGGQEDEDTCRNLDSLTKMLSDESDTSTPGPTGSAASS